VHFVFLRLRLAGCFDPRGSLASEKALVFEPESESYAHYAVKCMLKPNMLSLYRVDAHAGPFSTRSH
jgi:hypothetical protein